MAGDRREEGRITGKGRWWCVCRCSEKGKINLIRSKKKKPGVPKSMHTRLFIIVAVGMTGGGGARARLFSCSAWGLGEVV